jgi:hypothetical protein
VILSDIGQVVLVVRPERRSPEAQPVTRTPRLS